MSNPVVRHGVVLVCGLTSYRKFSSHFFKQLEHYTFYGLVGAIPKEVLILARRHEYLLAVDGKARVLNLH